MKLKKLTIFAAVILTSVMVFVAWFFRFFSLENDFTKSNYILSLAIAILLMLMVNYFALVFLLQFYGRKQIQKISDILPGDIHLENDENLNFVTLGQKFSELSQKNAIEMDTMKEMETYRKEYVGNVSHELKTPLFSIQGYVETLRDGGVENLNIRDKYLERIDKSVERLLNIVKDLDMINQYESGEIKLDISNFDINALVREIIELLEFEAQKKNARMNLVSSPGSIYVEADKQKISQVLINLISNAIHYSNREKAQITIKTSALRNKIFVEVIDNGMGIKPELLPRIFERFYRVESSRSRREGGSGLGLAIVKHILEAHGENIHVESKYLEGTRFSFTLDKDL